MARVDNTGGAGYVIDNGTGAAVRTKLNQITAAINSLNSGSGDPSINSAFQPHIDTGSSLFKIRNAANNAYVTIGNISLDNLGHVVAATPVMTGDVTMSSTGFLKVPVGTTAQRSGSPTAGDFRYNSTTGAFEGYTSEWGSIGGSSGITTAAQTVTDDEVHLALSSAQDHKITATGICTIFPGGGTEAESHTVRIINSGIATVGFSTQFLFPSGSAPSLPTADGAISLISFTINKVGVVGIATELLAGASVNFN